MTAYNASGGGTAKGSAPAGGDHGGSLYSQGGGGPDNTTQQVNAVMQGLTSATHDLLAAQEANRTADNDAARIAAQLAIQQSQERIANLESQRQQILRDSNDQGGGSWWSRQPTWLKWAIPVGAVLVVGGGGYAIYVSTRPAKKGG